MRRQAETRVVTDSKHRTENSGPICRVQPDAGAIYLEADGDRTHLMGRQPEDIVRLGVTLVPEGRRLFPKLTVEENLLLGAFRADARRDRDHAI